MGRVQGHFLVAEGAPHDENGERSLTWMGGVSGYGRAKCSCGAMSVILRSARLRRQWHRDHKEEVR